MPVVTRGPPTDVGQSSNAPRHPSKDHDARKGDSAGIKATAGVFPNDKRTVSRAWSPGSPRGGGGGHCQLSQQFGRMILRLQGEPAGEGVPASQDDVREGVPAGQDDVRACAKPVIVRQVASDLGNPLGRAGRIHQLLAALGAQSASIVVMELLTKSNSVSAQEGTGRVLARCRKACGIG